MEHNQIIRFSFNDMWFEYDVVKNQQNIAKHGISLKKAAQIFWDYDRIEVYDDKHSTYEDRYNVIGDASAKTVAYIQKQDIIIGKVGSRDILFVVYTQRKHEGTDGSEIDVTRLISARYATDFERGIYYGRYN